MLSHPWMCGSVVDIFWTLICQSKQDHWDGAACDDSHLQPVPNQCCWSLWSNTWTTRALVVFSLPPISRGLGLWGQWKCCEGVCPLPFRRLGVHCVSRSCLGNPNGLWITAVLLLLPLSLCCLLCCSALRSVRISSGIGALSSSHAS